LDGLRRLAPLSLVALPLVRWELGALAVVLALAGVLRRSLPWRRLGLAVGVAAVLAVPWLAANQVRYGDALYHSDRNAIYLRNLDIVYRGAPGPVPDGPFAGPRITWAGYYLDFVGPVETARREVAGTAENVASLLGASPNPPWPGWPDSTAGRMADVGRVLALLAGTLLAGLAVIRARGPLRWTVRVAAVVVLLDAAAYGAISRWVEYRLLSWALPMLALVLAAGVFELAGYRARTGARNCPV